MALYGALALQIRRKHPTELHGPLRIYAARLRTVENASLMQHQLKTKQKNSIDTPSLALSIFEKKTI